MPDDATMDELLVFVRKCGLVFEDPHSGQPVAYLFRNEVCAVVLRAVFGCGFGWLGEWVGVISSVLIFGFGFSDWDGSPSLLVISINSANQGRRPPPTSTYLCYIVYSARSLLSGLSVLSIFCSLYSLPAQDGSRRNDAMATYLLPPSVDNALQILDEAPFRASSIARVRVVRAVWRDVQPLIKVSGCGVVRCAVRCWCWCGLVGWVLWICGGWICGVWM